MSDIVAIQKTTTVEVTGVSENGITATCDITIQHTPEVSEEMILMAALNKVKANGGIVSNSAAGMEFFPAAKLVSPIKFRTKNIISLSA